MLKLDLAFICSKLATDSSFCRTALLGFAIRMGALVDMKEGDNQRDQGESEPRLRKARALR